MLFVFGYTRVHVHGSSALEVEFVDNTDGQIRDRFRIAVTGHKKQPKGKGGGLPRAALLAAAGAGAAVIAVGAAVWAYKRLRPRANVGEAPPAPRTPSAYQTL